MPDVDAECRAQLSRAVREVGVPAGRAASPAHEIDAAERLERANEHGAGQSFRAGDGVEAPMNAVDEVDVRDAGGPIQRFGSASPSRRSVTCEIVFADVGLRLDDAAARHTFVGVTFENAAE